MVTHPSLPVLPPRPVLRPGLRVVRRDARHLQVGIDPPHRVILDDDPDVRRVLDGLRRGVDATPRTLAGFRCLTTLVEADLVVDADEIAAAAGEATAAGAAAAYARLGPSATARLAARKSARVAVDASAETRESVSRLLRAAGSDIAGEQANVHARLIVSPHAICRDELDPLVRGGVPHLVVTGADGGFTVGPFVVPGRTACLRCVDAHLAESDPRRSVIIEQVAQARPAAGIEPRDPVLHALVLAWAVRDLLSFVEGDEPSTWSASVSFGAAPVPVRRTWTRHPHCGCTWGDLMAAG